MLRMNRRASTVALGLCLAVGASMLRWPARISADEAAQSPSPEVTKLQQEQVETLRQACDLASQLFSRGLVPTEDVNRLNRQLMETRLRIATSADDRAAALRDGLAAAKDEEKLANQQFKAGVASELAVLETKANRLSVEEKLAEAGVK